MRRGLFALGVAAASLAVLLVVRATRLASRQPMVAAVAALPLRADADLAAHLDELRPFGTRANPTEDRTPWEDLEGARAILIARYPSSDDVCSGVCAWASGMASAAYEHALTPVLRIGAIAWLAHVALAGVVPPVMGGAS